MKKFAILVYILFAFSAVSSAQCSTIHFMRSSFGLGSDASIYVYQADKYLFTINRGDRVDLEYCAGGELRLKASLTREQLSLFSTTKIQAQVGETYYVKVGAILGLDEPTLTLLRSDRGAQQYAKDNKFKGVRSQHVIGNPSSVTNGSASPPAENSGAPLAGSRGSATPTSPETPSSSNNAPPSTAGIVTAMMARAKAEQDYGVFANYYMMGRKLYDARTDKVVADNFNPDYVSVHSSGNLIAISGFKNASHTVDIISPTGNRVRSFTVQGFISPDLTYVITREDADLHRAEIDILSGQLTNKRQITALGVFPKYFYHQQWYGDRILFRPTGGYATIGTQYLIDTKTEQISNFHQRLKANDNDIPVGAQDGLLGKRKDFKSPDRRYALSYVRGNEQGLYDMATDQYLPNFPASSEFSWLTNEDIILRYFDGQQHNLIVQHIPTQKMEVIDQTTGPAIAAPLRNNVSPGGGYFLYTMMDNDRKTRLFIYDITNSSGKLLEEDGSSVVSVGLLGPRRTGHAWLSDHEMVYVKAGDLLEQGTWYVDAKSMQTERLSSYKADRIFPLQGTGLVYFLANKKLFRHDRATKETTTVLLENPYLANSMSPLPFTLPLYLK